MNELVPIRDIEQMAVAVAKSNLFGLKTQEQALALMLISHAEGRHPALAARDYDIIQGRPAKKAEAMLRDFLTSGGTVEWHELGDNRADATFQHPQGGSARIDWDMGRAQQAGLGGKDMWQKYPRQMLRARVISEGVRTVCPMATSGMYVPEEVQDFEPKSMGPAPRVEDPAPKPQQPPEKPGYPQDRFEDSIPSWKIMLRKGKTAEVIIKTITTRYTLSKEQIARIQALANDDDKAINEFYAEAAGAK